MNVDIETVGPFSDGEYHRLTINGYRVPYLRACRRKGSEELWDVILGNRFVYEMTDVELRNALPLIANAMAIAAGQSCFGEQGMPLNPFKVRMAGIDTVISEIEVNDETK